MQPTLFRYIWQGSKKGQLIVFLLTMLALPFYYVSLELPKLIINGVLGAQPSDFPVVISAFGKTLVDIDRIGWLLVLCIAFLLAVAAQGGVKFALNVYKGRLGGEQLLRLRRAICSRVLQLPPESFERMSSDEISTMIGTELTEVGGFIGEAFATPLLQGGLLITAIAFIFVQDGWLGFAAIALFPIQGYVIPRLQLRVNALTRDRIVAMRALAARLREATDALPEIQAAGGGEVELDAIEKRLLRIYDIRYAIFWRRSFIKLLNSFLFQLTPFLFLLIGGYFVLEGTLTLGALVAVLAAYKDLPPPARELLDYYQSLQNVRVQYEQVVGQFEAPESEAQSCAGPTGATATERGRGIEVEALELSKGASLLIEAASFSVGAGSAAVLGLTDAAGTALGRALVGLDKPERGSVRIGATEAASLSAAERQGIMLISGRGALFNGSLRENLCYGLRNTDLPLEHALESLAVVRLSADLPFLGLNTVLDPAARELAGDRLLRARREFRSRLDSEGLVEAFDAGAVCRHTSLAENIVWGRPLSAEIKLEDLGEHPAARAALKRARLEPPLLELAMEIGRRVLASEGQRRPGDDFLDELVFADERVAVRTALLQADPRTPPHPTGAERRLLLSIALRVVPARHSRLPVGDDLMKSVLAARRSFARALTPAARSRIEFFDPDRYMQALTVRENLVFGVVKGARSQSSVARLESMLLALVEEYELGDIIARAGLEYPIGLHGHRLTAEQRQKLELARVLMRKPDVAVIQGATDHIDRQTAPAIVSGLAEAQRGAVLIWILEHPSLARYFDTTLLFEGGRLVASGPYEDLDRAGAPLRALYLPE